MDSSGRLDGEDPPIGDRLRAPVIGVVAVVILLAVSGVLLWGFFDGAGTAASDQAGTEPIANGMNTTTAVTATPAPTVTPSPPVLSSTITSTPVPTVTSAPTPASPATPTPTETTISTPNTLSIHSIGDERVYYNVTVTGSIERAPTAEPSNTVLGTSATGSAAQRGWDNFTFTGRITALTLEGGPARVFVNGEQIDPDEFQPNSTLDTSIHADSFSRGYPLVQGRAFDQSSLPALHPPVAHSLAGGRYSSPNRRTGFQS